MADETFSGLSCFFKHPIGRMLSSCEQFFYINCNFQWASPIWCCFGLTWNGALYCSSEFNNWVFLLLRVGNELTFMNLDPDLLLKKAGAMLLLRISIFSAVFVEAQTTMSLIAY